MAKILDGFHPIHPDHWPITQIAGSIPGSRVQFPCMPMLMRTSILISSMASAHPHMGSSPGGTRVSKSSKIKKINNWPWVGFEPARPGMHVRNHVDSIPWIPVPCVASIYILGTGSSEHVIFVDHIHIVVVVVGILHHCIVTSGQDM